MVPRFTRLFGSALVLATLAAACSDGGSISGAEPSGRVASKGGKPGGGDTGATISSYYCSGVAGFIGYQIAPYCTGGPFGGFQSTSGTGYQNTITITFANPVSYVSLVALDPDYGGNSMVARDGAGNQVGSIANFVGDNSPGNYTSNRQSVSGYGIKYVVLTPNAYDYVAYDSLSFY